MSKENRTSDKQENGNDFIADVMEQANIALAINTLTKNIPALMPKTLMTI